MSFPTSRNNNEIVSICCSGKGAMLSCKNMFANVSTPVALCRQWNLENVTYYPDFSYPNWGKSGETEQLVCEGCSAEFLCVVWVPVAQRVAAGVRVLHVFFGKLCWPARAALRRGSGGKRASPRPARWGGTTASTERVTAARERVTAAPAGRSARGRPAGGTKPLRERGGPGAPAGRGEGAPGRWVAVGACGALLHPSEPSSPEVSGSCRVLLPAPPRLSNNSDPQPQLLTPRVFRGANPSARSPAPGDVPHPPGTAGSSHGPPSPAEKKRRWFVSETLLWESVSAWALGARTPRGWGRGLGKGIRDSWKDWTWKEGYAYGRSSVSRCYTRPGWGGGRPAPLRSHPAPEIRSRITVPKNELFPSARPSSLPLGAGLRREARRWQPCQAAGSGIPAARAERPRAPAALPFRDR